MNERVCKHAHIFVDKLKRKRSTKTFLITSSKHPTQEVTRMALSIFIETYSILQENTQASKHILYLCTIHILKLNFERAINIT